MRVTHFDASAKIRGGEWWGDMAAWLQENGEDNHLQQERLRRNLRRAREEALTPRQKEVLALHYERGLSVTEIARHLGVNPSTVSRTLHRAHERLKRCLQYAL